MLSNYTTTFVDEAEAAVAIVRSKKGKNKMPFRLSLDIGTDSTQHSFQGNLVKADSKDESERATVNIRGSLQGEGKPALVYL